MMKKTEKIFDVIIAGGGPAGLSLARMLGAMDLSVAVVEKQPRAALENPADDGREIALTHLSKQIMTDEGLWERISAADISLIREAKVQNGQSPYTLHFDPADTGRENLGFMVANCKIRKAAFAAAAAAPHVTIIDGAEVVKAETSAEKAFVTLSGGRTLSAKLLVAADSRFSTLRGMMGIDTDKLDFKRTCIVGRMSHQEPNDGIAYECFFYDRTLAVLPLNRDHCSIVITLDTKDADDVMKADPAALARDVEDRIDDRLGKMKVAGKLYSYPLIAVYAREFHKQRFALLGDAAVGMHPVTAHGFNLGLRGAATLAAEIGRALDVGIDIGADSVLAAYSRAHRRASKVMYEGTNTLVKLYTARTPVARIARGALLRLGNRLSPVKKMIKGQLTEIPAAERKKK